jgi:hypothetical protein
MRNNMLDQTTKPVKGMIFRHGADRFLFVLLFLLGAVTSSVASPFGSNETTAEERESCRLDMLNDWLSETRDNPTPGKGIAIDRQHGSAVFKIQSLQMIRETPLFESIANDCSYFVEEFNAAAGLTCVLQNQHKDFSYSEFWNIGPINMDGEWLLAADLLLSNNLEDALPLVPCADSCYRRDFTRDDCHDFATAGPSLLNITSITTIDVGGLDPFEQQDRQQTLCDLGWLDADKAYQNLRVCAAESNVARTMIAENDRSRKSDDINSNYSMDSERSRRASAVAGAYEEQRQKQASCAYLALSSSDMCALNPNNSTRDDPGMNQPGGNLENVIDASAGTSIATMEIAATTGMLLLLLF